MSWFRSAALSAALVLVLPSPFLSPASAHQIRAGALVIHHPWTRATPPGAEVAAGYLTIENTGTVPDRLLGGSLEGTTGFEVHTMSQSGGVMRMRPVEGGLTIPAKGSVVLKPSGTHIMYTGLKAALQEEDELDGTLVFEHAGTVAVEVMVEGLAARQAVEAAGHHAHGHEGGTHEGMSMPGEAGQ